MPRRKKPSKKEKLVAAALSLTEKKIYDLLSTDEAKHIDDIVKQTGLNSSGVLATLFDLEMNGLIRKSPGKLFSKVLF
jgi:predicted Rossmann fold nucleotide-binding protein DprA/Smf involved in DNA uptake